MDLLSAACGAMLRRKMFELLVSETFLHFEGTLEKNIKVLNDISLQRTGTSLQRTGTSSF